MIKVVNLVSLIAAPILVRYQTLSWIGWGILIILFGLTIRALLQSKKTLGVHPAAAPAPLPGD